MSKNPNPQGKGMVTAFALLDQNITAIRVPAKHVEQVSNELFTAMFVLHSKFQFKPVIGRSYWLYRDDHGFSLSMISPDEWPANKRPCIGRCELHADMSWTLELSEQALEDGDLMLYIEQQRYSFETAMSAVSSMDEAMPYYVSSLPFYQRVFASAFACSLRSSMVQSGIRGLTYGEAARLSHSES